MQEQGQTEWQELWMKASKDFFQATEKNLKELFSASSLANPEEQLKQVNEWLEALKKQWQFSQLTKEQQAYQSYWKMMEQMYNQAADMMLSQWTKRSQSDNPVQTLQEFYTLWMQCCQQVYQQALQSDAYKETYKELMNAAMKFWQTTVKS